jgi:hypothetical protein
MSRDAESREINVTWFQINLKLRFCFVLAALVAPAALLAQEPPAAPANPITASEKGFYALVSHQGFCSTATGGTNPMKAIEKTKTSKADLVVALKEAVAYCNQAFAGMTDAQGAQTVKMMNYSVAKLTVLSVNTAHTDEHYGNMVTYLRLKGIVPPSSESRGSQGAK